jgi:glycosyltransferase involved in cell wall biosynthesis
VTNPASPAQPPVTIVIPAHNHARYVDEAIRSVLSQDYARVELIVLDDGSRDNTREVLQRYGNRFHWETHENMGQSATLAKGWSLAHGEILGYLSADDRLEPSVVSESIARLGLHPEAVATYCDFYLMDPDSRVVRRVNAPDFDFPRMLATATCAPGPGAFFRRSAYERAGPWDARLRQMPDLDFWFRLGLFGPFVRIPKALAGFRVHETSLTYSRVPHERAAEPVAIVTRFFERTDLPQELSALRNEAVANAELVSAQLHLRAGRLAAAWSSVRRASSSCRAAVWSSRSVRLLANAALNRLGHRVLWTLKSLRPRLRT